MYPLISIVIPCQVIHACQSNATLGIRNHKVKIMKWVHCVKAAKYLKTVKYLKAIIVQLVTLILHIPKILFTYIVPCW